MSKHAPGPWTAGQKTPASRTRFEVENKATGEKGSLSLQEVFESASNAIDKVHGEINE